MLLKMIAEGFFGYVKNGFNLFDSFIVILRFCCSSLYLQETRSGVKEGTLTQLL